MKIKFIKEYVAVDPVPTSGIIHRYRVGETEEITPYTAQWLIDSGFAMEVKEPEWVRKQISKVEFGKQQCVEVTFRFVKDCFYYHWDSQDGGQICGHMAGTVEKLHFNKNSREAKHRDTIEGLNQMISDGYIEVEENSNIVWEDNNEN